MYLKQTNGVIITAEPEYEDELSMPFDDYYVWDYHIVIRNTNNVDVQLLNRYWKIIDEKGQIQEVRGSGVVGAQPVIKPNEEFSYSSTVHLNTSSGVMMGFYEMMTSAAQMFKVEIPVFSLDCPHVKKAVN